MRRASLPFLAVLLLLASATVTAARRLDVAAEKPYDVSFIPRASVLRWLSLGHPTVAADAYYLKAVQYIGEPQSQQRGWDKLYPLLDVVTDLDPRHGYAYQVGGIILGSVGRVAESSALLEKGMRNVPDRYILPYLRAFNAIYYDADYVAAGRFAEIAAMTPGAPPHLRQNVLAYYVKGRRPEAAIAFIEDLLRDAHDNDSRDALREQLKQAQLERDATRLEDALAVYHASRGVSAHRLDDLVTARLIDRVPRDPFGGEYFIGRDGRVRSSAHAFRFSPPNPRLGTEPGVHPEQYEGMVR